MNSSTIAFIIAACVGGAVYFVVQWITLRRQLTTMTYIERSNAEIAEDNARRSRKTFKERFRLWFTKRGYRGDLTPLMVAAALLYLVAILVLRVFGIAGFAGGIVAVPVCFGAASLGFATVAARRRHRFNRQLVQAFELIGAQLEGGFGTQRALEMVVPNLPNPLREEFTSALDSTLASRDLIGALREVGERYPSRGYDMFVAALEIDKEKGGSLAPALRQAAEMLQREFELSDEAAAEVTQSKQTFYGVLAIVGLIIMVLLGDSDSGSREAYTSPFGIGILLVVGANLAFGVYRILRLLNRARGEL